MWHIYGDLGLSRRALKCIDNAAAQGLSIGVSAISLAEVVYLVEKRRIRDTAFADLCRAFDQPAPVFQLLDVTRDILATMQTISREDVRDLPDRQWLQQPHILGYR